MGETTGKSWSRRTRWLAAAAGIVVLAGAGTLVWWLAHRGRHPSRAALDSEQYRQIVSAFYTGVSAMDVDNNDLARSDLTRATQLAPDEPAAWADLGLLHLRAGELDAANRELDKAHALAPDNSAIEMLLGLLESRKGNFAAAGNHFRRATELDPRNLRARYAIATNAEREGGPDAPAEVRRQFDQILRVQPENLAVLLDAIREAAKSGDGKAAADLVDRLARLSANWPAPAKAQLRSLQKLVTGANLRQAATQSVFLRNVLVREPQFRDSLAAVMTPLERIGEPIEHFLTLPSPRPTPAPADEQLTFSVDPLSPAIGSGWSCAAAAWLDKDGPPVMFVASATQVRRADGKGQVIPLPGGQPAQPPAGDAVLAVDWMNDFRPGLVLAGAGGVRLLRQTDQDRFEDVTTQALGDDPVVHADCWGAWPADVDLDGDLDIVLALRKGPPVVLRNNSDGTFKVIRPFEGISGVRSFAWADLSGDGAPEACFLDETGKLVVFANERSGKFRLRPLPDSVGKVVAIAVADVDRDGLLDLIALKADGQIVRISSRRDGSDWEVAPLARLPEPIENVEPGTLRLIAADVDNNGAVDLVVAGPNDARVWLADADGQFRLLPATINGRLSCAAELSASGRLELLGLSSQGTPIRVDANGSRGYRWQTVKPRAQALKGDGRINSFAIGGEMEVRAGLLVQKMPIQDGAVHFGLGENPQTDAVRIVWPNGSVQAEFQIRADQEVVAEQRLKGSCPMLFAWDGRQMSFVTDLIWRSPLGLRIDAQDTAAAMQTRDWVKVRADQLAPRDGYYDLRVTAELWETHYFDYLSLMTVDHPAGTQVFVDERFAIPQPPLTLYLTSEPQPVTQAWDEHGNDVTDIVRRRDGRYLDTFGRGRYQGITADHWVEIELGNEIPVNKPLVLLAFAWVHPTDSSINLAVAQGEHEPPHGLVMEVSNGRGGWRVARDGLGFPAGKNKTIVLPLDGLWKPGEPRRLRLRTNLEVYWDWLACAALADEGEIRTRQLPAQEAELDYRGFSRIEQADAHSPEMPDYQTIVGTMPRWRDLAGYYTRFGDVRELLEKVDDRYVIMNAGDELRLRFAAPPAPAPGWVRDFVMVADGWEKDGDYNTAFSRTVLPLPRHDWPTYDVAPKRLEDDPVYRRHPDDWARFHTRYVSGDDFRDALRPHE